MENSSIYPGPRTAFCIKICYHARVVHELSRLITGEGGGGGTFVKVPFMGLGVEVLEAPIRPCDKGGLTNLDVISAII